MAPQNIVVGDYVKVVKHLKGAHNGADRVLAAGTEGIVVQGQAPGWLVVDFGTVWGERIVSTRHLAVIGTAYRVTPVEAAYQPADGAA